MPEQPAALHSMEMGAQSPAYDTSPQQNEQHEASSTQTPVAEQVAVDPVPQSSAAEGVLSYTLASGRVVTADFKRAREVCGPLGDMSEEDAQFLFNLALKGQVTQEEAAPKHPVEAEKKTEKPKVEEKAATQATSAEEVSTKAARDPAEAVVPTVSTVQLKERPVLVDSKLKNVTVANIVPEAIAESVRQAQADMLVVEQSMHQQREQLESVPIPAPAEGVPITANPVIVEQLKQRSQEAPAVIYTQPPETLEQSVLPPTAAAEFDAFDANQALLADPEVFESEELPATEFDRFTEALLFVATESELATMGTQHLQLEGTFEGELPPITPDAPRIILQVAERLTTLTPLEKERVIPIVRDITIVLKEVRMLLTEKAPSAQIEGAQEHLTELVVQLFEATGIEYEEFEVQQFVQTLMGQEFMARAVKLSPIELMRLGTREVKVRFQEFFAMLASLVKIPIEHLLGMFAVHRAHPYLRLALAPYI